MTTPSVSKPSNGLAGFTLPTNQTTFTFRPPIPSTVGKDLGKAPKHHRAPSFDASIIAFIEETYLGVKATFRYESISAVVPYKNYSFEVSFTCLALTVTYDNKILGATTR